VLEFVEKEQDRSNQYNQQKRDNRAIRKKKRGNRRNSKPFEKTP
jgi:hypothetical protein